MKSSERVDAKERVKRFYLKHMQVPDIVRMLTHEEGKNPIDISEDEVRDIIAELRAEWENEIFAEGKMRVVEELMSLDELEMNAWRDKKYNNVWKIKVLRVRLFDLAFDIGKKMKADAKIKQQIAKRYNLELPGLEKDKEEASE